MPFPSCPFLAVIQANPLAAETRGTTQMRYAVRGISRARCCYPSATVNHPGKANPRPARFCQAAQLLICGLTFLKHNMASPHLLDLIGLPNRPVPLRNTDPVFYAHLPRIGLVTQERHPSLPSISDAGSGTAGRQLIFHLLGELTTSSILCLCLGHDVWSIVDPEARPGISSRSQ
jgi:hypothetical protein